MKFAMYCDRPARGGIGNYAREIAKRIPGIELGFIGHLGDKGFGVGNMTYPIREEGTKRLLHTEGVDYTALTDQEVLEADLHHGVDASLSWIVPKVNKSVITLHDIDDEYRIELTGIVNRPYLEPHLADYLKQATRIIVDSKYMEKRALGSGMPENKIRVVYCGADTEIFKPYDGSRGDLRGELEEKVSLLKQIRGKRIIINNSSEETRKNVPDVLKAFARIRRNVKDVALIRIGYPEVPQKDSNVNLQHILGIDRETLYINMKVDRETIAHLYNISDLMLFPTVREGFGLVFAEAMASECPIVAYQATTAPEVVGQGGLLVPLDSGPEGLAYACLKILEDDNLHKVLGKNGRKRVEENFTWEKAAEATMKVYNEVLE